MIKSKNFLILRSKVLHRSNGAGQNATNISIDGGFGACYNFDNEIKKISLDKMSINPRRVKLINFGARSGFYYGGNRCIFLTDIWRHRRPYR